MVYKLLKIIEDEIEYEVYEFLNGSKFWYLNNQLHRINGPAIEYFNGYKIWYRHGKYHREDGAAVIYSYGIKEYWLNDIHYPDIASDEEWIKLVNKLIIKEIIE
jgi:hypothetical protein